MIIDLRIALGVLLLIRGAINSQSAPSLPDPEKDSQMRDLISEATRLVDGKKPQPAIEKCEKVIASFKAYYGSRPEKIYCARTSAESLGYLLKAAAGNDRGTSREGKAIVLSSSWAEAYFIKAFALHDLGRIAESKSAIMLAIELSPWNCKYLCELGSIYQIEKNWPQAKEAFETAEGQASLGPDNVKAAELSQARRGLGYVLVELGRLDEAEKKYQQCLAANPKDTKAARELEYVRGLRAKTKSL
jgi:tetratricopeptide (TPR) repeat protein